MSGSYVVLKLSTSRVQWYDWFCQMVWTICRKLSWKVVALVMATSGFRQLSSSIFPWNLYRIQIWLISQEVIRLNWKMVAKFGDKTLILIFKILSDLRLVALEQCWDVNYLVRRVSESEIEKTFVRASRKSGKKSQGLGEKMLEGFLYKLAQVFFKIVPQNLQTGLLFF